MDMLLVVAPVVLLLAVVAYKLGKKTTKIEVLEDEVEASKNRDSISSLSDKQLDDELRDYWK